jgi:hypothetical protein
MGDVHQPEKLGGARAGAAEGGVIRGPGSHLRHDAASQPAASSGGSCPGQVRCKKRRLARDSSETSFQRQGDLPRFRVAPDLPRFGPYFAYFPGGLIK